MSMDRIFQDINKQMMETTYTLRLSQLLKITPDLNKYMWHKLKPKKPNVVNKMILEPSVTTMIETHSEVDTIVIEVNNQMVVIQVQVGKKIVEDVLIDGGASVNIIIKNLITKLGLPKPKLAPYTLKMANQNMTKPLRIIRNLRIHIHGIPYVATFTILKNNVVDFNYYMLMGKLWLRDVKVTHDWGNNVITIQGNGIIRTISLNKKLGVETRRLQVLVCYDLLEGLTYEEEDLIFETKPKLFLIGTIIISNETISLLNIRVLEIIINGKSNPKQQTSNQRVAKMVPSIINTTKFHVRPKISLEDKVYPKTYYHHSQADIEVDETPTKIQVQNLRITSWTLIEEQ